ncbi:TlpA family protein disulfide reductase [Psychrosphaera algicola]|uniref:Redoxin domain-containing protein n=1 Tax=Psychrosphaera algicola TaxID=3023714 RepID=A0ABT5FB33_9GAMM|nr:redoxin domain-containing protein [Psychrosphaera sp. G1-22]MDC2887796.1 redoxin domain-containing protein [Psychrosphaera sp. G1-22]
MFKNILTQIVVVFLVFNLVSTIRETSLLSYDETVHRFIMPTVKGTTVNSEQLKGKPTLIYFWAPWCSVCNISLPNLQDFYRDYGSEINIVSVVLSYQQIEDVHMKIIKHKLDFPVLLGTNEVADEFNITGFPTYYLLDADQKVVSKSLGYSSELGMRLRALIL